MSENSFDNFVRQKMDEHEYPVPAGTWEAIAQKKKRRRRFIIFWWTTGAGMLLLATGIYLLSMNSTENTNAGKNITSSTATAQERAVAGADQPASVNKSRQQNIPAEETNKDDAGKNLQDTGINNDAAGVKSRTENVAVLSAKSTGKNAEANKAQSITAPVVKKKPGAETGKETNTAREEGLAKNNSRVNNDVSTSAFVKETNSKSLSSSYPLPASREVVKTSEAENPVPVSKIIFKENFIRDFLNDDVTLPLPARDSVNKYIEGLASGWQSKAARKWKRPTWFVEAGATALLPVQRDDLLYITRHTTTANQHATYIASDVRVVLQPGVAYNISVRKKLNNRLHVSVGLQYASLKEKIDLSGREERVTYEEIQRMVNGTNGPELITDTVEMNSAGIRRIDALNSYQMISVPLSVQYQFYQRAGWSLRMHGGVFFNIRARYDNRVQGNLLATGAGGAHDPGRRSQTGFDLFAGLRLSRSIGSWELFTEPSFRYNLTRYNLVGMINKKYIHQPGISLGASYLLRR